MWKVQHWMLHSNGENNNYSLWSKCTHCLLVYICILWPVYVVSDAVLCMLTCSWNMTSIHKQGQAGSHSVELINDCKSSVIFMSRFFDFWKYLIGDRSNFVLPVLSVTCRPPLNWQQVNTLWGTQPSFLMSDQAWQEEERVGRQSKSATVKWQWTKWHGASCQQLSIHLVSTGFAHFIESTHWQRRPTAEQSRGGKDWSKIYCAYVETCSCLSNYVIYDFSDLLGELNNFLTSNCYTVRQLTGLSWPHILSEVNSLLMSRAFDLTRCSFFFS